MTQEDKDLLLKDLCAKLPYGVKVHCKWNLYQGDRICENGELVSINTHTVSIKFKRNSGRLTGIPFNRIDGVVLPYLRPMSSMTDKEETELVCLRCGKEENVVANILDFYNSHYLDYRGLIPLGLALEAPREIYNLEKK